MVNAYTIPIIIFCRNQQNKNPKKPKNSNKNKKVYNYDFLSNIIIYTK